MAALSPWIWTCLVIVLVMKTTHVQGQSVVISTTGVFVLGNEKSIYCAVTTTKMVTVEWFVDGSVVSGTDLPTQMVSGWYIQKSRYTFTVTASDDGKRYTCRANTGSTTIQDTWTVYVYRHPDAPVISGPTSVTGGTIATWLCQVDGAVGSGPTVSWRFGNGTSIAPSFYTSATGFYSGSDGLIVRNVSSTLTLPITKGAPPFSLVCKSTQASTSNTQTATVSVSISYVPVVTVSGTFYTVTAGNDVTLLCDVKASPSPSAILWFHNGQAVNTSLGRYLGATATTPSLTIKTANRQDAGNYTCGATNTLGSTNASAVISLTVHYAPAISYSENPVSGVANTDVVLSCFIDAVPDFTTVYWYRVTSSNPEVTTTISSAVNPGKYSGGTVSTPALTIKNLATSDQGQYFCVADNNVGRGTGVRLTLNVVYAPSTVTVTVSNTTGFEEGGQISLTCSADGNPSPQYEWTKGSGSSQVLSTSSSLVYASATPARAGLYTCKAYNTVGSATASVNVVVFYSPRAADSLANVTARVGDTVTLTCAVIANPAPFSYSWTKDGVTLVASSSSSQLKVTVSEQADFGRYQCRATSRRGTSAPIGVFVFEEDDNVGQSTDDAGLSTTTLILIILVCIILLIVIILIIIYCCVSGKCGRQKKDNTVSPSVVAPPPIVPAGEKPIGQKPPNAVAATATPNGRVSGGAAPLSTRSGNGHLDTPRDHHKADPASNRNGTASLGHGMSISVPGGLTPRPHHLPPLGQDGVPEETESADDDKHRKKKRRRRHNADGTPQNNLEV